ncbi:MAG: TIGR03557 family F420-dependent LLM class oxidoreductase [Chloroflexia bacterium]|nr:TIGR03557 family F420-dependent LLM class oxidoreductase [Chloroflexia bacterium]
MVQLGYTLSSEEFRPNDIVAHARRAEETGFTFAGISDHFHPWVDAQKHSPFVWSTLGGIAQSTERLEILTGVTCPLIRIHPAIIAQAAATVADMLPGRFILGLGTGEYLNEHVTGAQWPPISKRQEMLVEAIGIMRDLWRGEYTTHYGAHYTVENARIYTLPETPPPIFVAAAGPESAALAGKHSDGLISTAPVSDVVKAYGEAGGDLGRVYGQLTVCWGKDKKKAVQTALEIWPNAGLSGQLTQELALPLYFEAATELVTAEKIEQEIVCGPDPAPFLEKIREYADAGFTHVYLHQIGPDQEGFLDFAKRELLPHATQIG